MRINFTIKNFVLLFAMLISIGNAAAISGYSGGAGTAGDPYKISTAEDLKTMSVTSDDWGKSFILTEDIDMVGDSIYPIGEHGGLVFSGSFDGGNHVIKNLKVVVNPAATKNYGFGFFGCITNATISNLGLIDPMVDPGSAYQRCGAFVGQSAGAGDVIDNCFSVGGVVAGTDLVGGIVGNTWHGTVSNCMSSTTIKVNKKTDGNYAGWNIGGIAGRLGWDGAWTAGSKLMNCVSYVTEYENKTNWTYALVGSLKGTKEPVPAVTDCYYVDYGVADANGTELNKFEASIESTYAGFDFAAEWTTNPVTGGFAVLSGFDAMYFTDIKMKYYSGGTGTSADPYLISNKYDILEFDSTKAHWTNTHFLMTADIDMAGDSIYPIGEHDVKVFSGSFDGGNHVIKNLKVVKSPDAVKTYGFGFFGCTGNATISNLGLIDPMVDGGSFYQRCGAIVGQSTGGADVITNCFSVGGVVAGTDLVGGIIGNTWFGTVSNCMSSTKIKINKKADGNYAGWNIGGIAGRLGWDGAWTSGSKMMNCASYVEEFENKTNWSYALVGSLKGSKEPVPAVTDCYYVDYGVADATGTGISLAVSTEQASYPAMDFTNTWAMKALSFPVLSSFDISHFAGLAEVVAEANAGADQAAYVGDYVELDGSASVGAGLNYAWVAPDFVDMDTTAQMPSFYVPTEITEDTVLTFYLTVSNEALTSPVDTVEVAVTGSYRDIAEISSDSWKFVSATSVREGQEPLNAFDGDLTSAVYSDWQDATLGFPFEFVFDLNAMAEIEALKYIGRQDQWGPNGTVTDYRIYISADGENWGEAVKDASFMYPDPVDANDKEYYKKEQYTVFDKMYVGQFVKFVADTALLTDATTNPQMGIAELKLYGKSLESPIVEPIPISPSNDHVELNGNIAIAKGGFDSVKPGDWAHIAVDVPQDDLYIMKFRVGLAPSWTPDESAFELEANGMMLDSVLVPATGDWTPSLWVLSDTFRLAGGDSTIFKITGRSNGSYCWNMDSIVLYQYNEISALNDVQEELSVEETKTTDITYTIAPSRANAVKQWFSVKDPSVAEVDENGTITGKAVGTTMVYTNVSDGLNEFSDSTALTVITYIVLADSMAILPETFITEGGGTDITDSLIVQFYPADTHDQRYLIRSSNPRAVAVDQGRLTALSPGTATLTAYSTIGGFKATCEVTVTPLMAKSIDVTPDSIPLLLNNNLLENSKRLTVKVLPLTTDDKTYEVTTSDESVAIYESGRVKAVGKGMCYVIVTSNSNGIQDSSKVVVIDPSGVNDLETSNSLNVYPNPVQGNTLTFTVPGNGVSSVVSIFDIQGKMVKQRTITSGVSQTIEFENGLNKGMYFIKAEISGKSYINKFTVQ